MSHTPILSILTRLNYPSRILILIIRKPDIWLKKLFATLGDSGKIDKVGFEKIFPES